MNSSLHQAYSAEHFRHLGHQLVDQLADYLTETTSNNSEPVLAPDSPAQALDFWQNSLNEQGIDKLPAWFDQIIRRSIHLHSPRYMGHQISPSLPVSALSGLLVDLLNNGMGIFEMGPAATTMEKIIVEKVAEQFGMTGQVGGFLTSGGTLANLTALLAARRIKAPRDVWIEGSNEKLAVMVSEEAHYCIDRAVRIMGLGSAGIIKIPVDQTFRMRSDLLEEYWQKAKDQGLYPIAVVGSACSTSTGAYDDLEAIAGFCQSKDLWFHVDGAHGAAVAFSSKYRSLVKGMHLADSVVMDFHKMLMTPALATALVFRNYENSFVTFSQRAQYLWQGTEGREWFNLARRTFECTKYMMSVKVFSILKAYGWGLFDDYVTRCYDLGKLFAQLVRQRTQLELATAPDGNIVCFRLLSGELSTPELNELNAAIRESIVATGQYYIVQTELDGKIYLRVTLTNPLTTEQDLEALLNLVERRGKPD